MKSLENVGIGLTRISHHHGQYEIRTKGGYWIDSDFPSSLSTMKLDMHQNQSPWVLMVSVLISIGFDCIGFVAVLRYCGHWD